MNRESFVGCLLGLALGDALGAPFEGGWLERALWRVLGRTRHGEPRWTDDTQMSLDLAESLLQHGQLVPDALAKQFAASYRWSRGYGPGTARVLKRIRRGEPWQQAVTAIYPDGSYGNGAAMRAPVLALFYTHQGDALIDAARQSAMITHAHPFGVQGAIMMSVAAQALLAGQSALEVIAHLSPHTADPAMRERMQQIRDWLIDRASPNPREVVQRLGNGMQVVTSCPTALYIALHHLDSTFDKMMRFVIACRGDVDTIGAMAGALWGIVHGSDALPPVPIEDRERIVTVATRLYDRHR